MYPFMMMPIYNLPNEGFFRPPLLCDLLNSLVNFTKPEDEKVKLSQIPNAAAPLVFDFEYPLSTNVDKTKFETMILKKFYTRRIGYETYTLWKMQLDVKLNEIMPVYNKLFDSMSNWNLFNDGENYTRTINNEHESNTETANTSETNTSTQNTTSNSVTNTRKFSNLPQNEISDIDNGNYMTDYTKENNSGTSTGNGSGSVTGNDSGTNQLSENSNTTETYHKDVSNKIDIYNKFLEDRNHIMSLIFRDLDSLFYGLSNFN